MEVKEPITEYGALDLSKRYTYDDYLKFQFEERVELIRGFIHKMSPAPKSNHQFISGELHLIIGNVFRNTTCHVFYAPFDVRLPIPTEKKEYTVVQPDLCIFCDRTKIDELGAKGAPDLIIEILSSNKKHDTEIKFDLYEEAGVLEYWIVDPDDQTIIIYSLSGGKYVGSRIYSDQLIVQSVNFPEIKFETKTIFET
jgi:Uma2 family endonuclease